MKLKNKLRKWHRWCKPGYMCFAAAAFDVFFAWEAFCSCKYESAFLWALVALLFALIGVYAVRLTIQARYTMVMSDQAFKDGANLASEIGAKVMRCREADLSKEHKRDTIDLLKEVAKWIMKHADEYGSDPNSSVDAFAMAEDFEAIFIKPLTAPKGEEQDDKK